MNILKIIISIFLWIFPWHIRCFLLNKAFGYKISYQARIGFSIIIPSQLEMGEYAKIGHLTLCKGLNILKLGVYCMIGNLNWISGFPLKDKTFFSHRVDRDPSLIIGDHSAITHRHLLDCTDKIVIDNFTTIAGYNSQLLTHSIDIMESRQDCKPIHIGSYCFISTSCILLPGSSLGDYCIMGANSLLNKNYKEQFRLYGGVPVVMIKKLPKNAHYFTRRLGFIE